MSEFNYTDIVVFKPQYDNQDVYQITRSSECGKWIEVEGIEGRISSSLFNFASTEEIAAGHRIDKPSNPRELETLDKPENHISPNCKVEDV
ncbi:hypothetical protein [Acinetobacter baumannii]|uniref:hypothetical protein n=1 Tax=Acinetobacter baumannii TaxID=470 RepID=UPI0023066C88|nr:hypothetical protein [Acinetobacter baumannii]MDB0300207.1 hypothetical protein [Acinetobacter baumannii]